MSDITLAGVRKAYNGKVVLDNLSETIRAGERLCVMGPSGCGKTTLLRLISGLEAPNAGEIRGVDANRLAYVFQEDRLIPHASALNNVTLAQHGRPRRERALNALNSLGLSDSASKPARELSGGMARRVAIARALITDAEVILMDEPFKGLDAENREKAMRFALCETEGKTLILVTHDVYEARYMRARIKEMAAQSVG